jgi:hypothetical protein
MASKKLMMAAAILAGTTLSATASLAQGYYGGPYGHYAPGPNVDFYGSNLAPYNYGSAVPDVDRGGPGPRVKAGSGMGIGADR